ncbi:Putative ABC1 protein [Apostasia shenzhenica]|uniref:ABC1 protein n=1 Tax=Apostasia shenzhenica TaxID=1088818 RepID=A0A2H9ZV10_9ASPA|nr:Putative ABC1 protein [Apostasia shenzhenica]
MGGSHRLLKSAVKTRAPLHLAAGATFFAFAWQASPGLLAGEFSPPSSSGEGIHSIISGVVRSSRAIYAISCIALDYKYSLRRLDPGSGDYRSKLSEVHLRASKRLLKLSETNGGFYVKAGQFVSSLRQVPKEYSSTLSCLQDQVTPCNIKKIKEVIVKSLGKDHSELFLSFDEKPIAAASIAQVHRGTLKNNHEVAVKVQYPGLEQRMKIDFTTMAILSKSLSLIFPDVKFDQILSEFKRTISLELDFVQEGKNSERTARNFKKNCFIKIPLVYWELTRSQVLTMEFCKGRKVAKALVEVFAEMIFVHGFVHGDPHPGNILVSVEGKKGFSLVLLDHGIYRELDERFRLDYCLLWKALILLDSRNIFNIGERFGVGKYSKYFPVIFTGRTIKSKSALGTQMSKEEKKFLKQELRSLRMGDISSFMESLPPEFLSILRIDGLLRSISSKLGASRRMLLLGYAKYAVYGLARHANIENGKII